MSFVTFDFIYILANLFHFEISATIWPLWSLLVFDLAVTSDPWLSFGLHPPELSGFWLSWSPWLGLPPGLWMGQVTLLLWQMPFCELKKRFSSQTGGKWGKNLSKKGWVSTCNRWAFGSEKEWKGRRGCCWKLSLPSPAALNPRLSPEIYLKRPAHSDDWRLDIMLKKKAVRRVVWLEGRYGQGVACGWRLIRRDYSIAGGGGRR